ncbi:MAG: hypothetical protein FWG45_00890 [Oscillospiraceae bacterium]|nr:hypothetical protein [Oscillospiraceae bacterium]
MKNFEILLIRPGTATTVLPEYPNVGRVYTSPSAECALWACSCYPELSKTLHTASNLRARDKDEANETYAIRCVAALNQLFGDLTRADIERAALIIDDETIVTLVAGCGMPRLEPPECSLPEGGGWLICMSSFLWQKGHVFEIIGKLTSNNAASTAS